MWMRLAIVVGVVASEFCCVESALATSRVQRYFLQSNDSPDQEYVISPMIVYLPFAAQEIGVRFSHELWNNGFLEKLNDSVSIEGSFFIGKWAWHDGLSNYASVNMRWDFHLVPEWTVFASPGLSVWRYGTEYSMRLSPSIQIGGFWNIQKDLAIRADVELEHFTPRVGLAFRY